VSHETIYCTLFVQSRGTLERELLAHLRSSGRMMRKGCHASTAGQRRVQIKDAVYIRERPPEAEDRAVAWPLGRGPLGRIAQHSRCYAGRTQLPVRDAGAGWRQGHRKRRCSPQRADKAATQDHDGHPHLGPGAGDRRPQEVHGSHRRCGLLFRISRSSFRTFTSLLNLLSSCVPQW
jgi:hypothetical protein